MRFETILANIAAIVLTVIVAWDVCVWFGIQRGHTITEEIRSDWRQWLFFVCAGLIAGGHFLRGK